MKKSILLLSATLLTAIFSLCSYAQNFLTPIANHFTYNGGLLTTDQNTRQVANYSIRDRPTGFGSADLYLSGWSSLNGGEVTWQFTAPGDNTNILAQGVISNVDYHELAVGSVRDNNGIDLILIAYRTGGIAYRLDVYRITNSTITPVAYNNTFPLSTNVGGDGRISMDCHFEYGVAIAWSAPAGIETRVMQSNAGLFSPVITLAGTGGNLSPDVAFSHANGVLNVHYVYYDPSTFRITESVVNFYTLLYSTMSTLAPTIEDINQLPIDPNNYFRFVRPVIDCPDHYDVENWAYTYTYSTTAYFNPYSTAGIFVRHVDYHSAGTPVTTDVTNGSLGNAPCVDYHPIAPALCYGEEMDGGFTGQIHVAWYNQRSTAPGGGMFVGVHMTEDGSSVINDPDYFLIPNPYNSYSINTSEISFIYDYYLAPIALSKNSDLNIAPNVLYTSYFYQDATPSFHLNHVFHKWYDNMGYKTNSTSTLSSVHADCSKQKNNPVLLNALKAQPNPFNEAFNISLNIPEDGVVDLVLSDISGRIVWKRSEHLGTGSHSIPTENLKNASAGIYLLNASLNGRLISTAKLVKQ